LGRAAILGIDVNNIWHNIQCSPDGSLNVNSLSGGVSATGSATWTAAMPPDTILNILSGSLRYSSLLVTFSSSGTFATGTAVVEGSNDNTNWFGLIGWDTGIEDVIVGTVGAFTTGSDAQRFNCSAWSYLRVRLSVAITGTGTPTVVVGYALQSSASLVQLAAIFTPIISMTFDGSENPISSTAGALDVNIKSTTAASFAVQAACTQSTSPWVVSLTSTTVTGTVAVTESGAWNVNQTLGTPGYEAITDGTTGPVAVKAASTAATAADKALVVTTNGSTTAGAPANTSVTSVSSAVLAANVARRECTIVNTDTVVIYIGLGQVPTATTYHIALSPCSVAHDATGGTYTSDIFKGAINAIVASTSGHVAITELT
jgi:hypothetical protein